MVRTTRDRGVNPVVATILLVGIVVILSAAVGAFVLELGADLDSSAGASVDVTDHSPNGTDGSVTVTIIGLEDADFVEVRATAPDGNRLDDGGTDVTELTTRLESAGDRARFEEGDHTGGPAETTVDLVAVAHRGGTASLVLDERVVL